MLTTTDTRILNARPDHLRPVTARERVADGLLKSGRQSRVTRLLRALRRPMARRVSLLS